LAEYSGPVQLHTINFCSTSRRPADSFIPSKAIQLFVKDTHRQTDTCPPIHIWLGKNFNALLIPFTSLHLLLSLHLRKIRKNNISVDKYLFLQVKNNKNE
jgi:hypothetical protein